MGLALLSAGPAWALYKVVGPDGRVTYTDRPPVDRPAVAIKTNGSTVATDGLPFELQRVVGRYPVTLYTSSKCAPCDAARQMLQGRGVPYVEKTVETADDIKALQQQENAQQLPVGKIGSKQLIGFAQADWVSYLDAAGYPAKSVLPSNYRQPLATPLAPAPTTTAVVPEQPNLKGADTPSNVSPPPSPTPNVPPGFKF
ncbi:MAG: glutaredoxin family protein [Rubrivivax sp.]|nr:MAG: glutaredoxin family protein [Rubrivivax sp.]